MKRFLTRPVLAMLAVASWAAVAAAPAAALVVDQSPAGFTSRNEYMCTASPEKVWDALTNDISRWWNPAHTWSGDADNLFLTGAAGEEFGEKLPDGGSVTHMEVIYADPGKLLRLRGSLGPLQAMAVVGVLSIELAPEGETTKLTVTYAVGGYGGAGGIEEMAGPVNGVIAEQFARLRDYVGQ